MLSLDDDQKVELEIELIRLQQRGVITDDQRSEIMCSVLGIVLTPEEIEYERRAIGRSPFSFGADITGEREK